MTPTVLPPLFGLIITVSYLLRSSNALSADAPFLTRHPSGTFTPNSAKRSLATFLSMAYMHASEREPVYGISNASRHA